MNYERLAKITRKHIEAGGGPVLLGMPGSYTGKIQDQRYLINEGMPFPRAIRILTRFIHPDQREAFLDELFKASIEEHWN